MANKIWEGVVICPKGCDGGRGRTGRKKLDGEKYKYVLTPQAWICKTFLEKMEIQVISGTIEVTDDVLGITEKLLPGMHTLPKGVWKIKNPTEQDASCIVYGGLVHNHQVKSFLIWK